MPLQVLADWLVFCVRDDKVLGLGMLAYGPASHFILRGEDLSHGIILFAESQGTMAVEKVRHACAKAIEILDFSLSDDLTVADVVLQVATGLRAIGVLEELARKAAVIPPDDWPFEFFQIALEFARLSAPRDRERSGILLRHLVTATKRFPQHQVAQTMRALVTCQPDAFADHWELLAHALEAKYGLVADVRRDRLEERRCEMRDELLATLAPNVIDKRQLLLAENTKSGHRMVAPNWWLDTLARSKNAEVLRALPALPDFLVAGHASVGAELPNDPATLQSHSWTADDIEEIFSAIDCEPTSEQMEDRLAFSPPPRLLEAA